MELRLEEFDAQNRGTRGKAGVTNLSDDDAVLEMFLCSSHDTLLAISAKGVAYALPAYKVPTTSRVARGTSLMQLLPLEADEDFAAAKLLPVRSFSASVYLLLLTSAGWIKKTPIEAFAKIRASGLTALKFTSEGDTVYRAALCAEGDSVVLASRLGQTLRFQCDEKQLRASGRTSRGVKSMVLRDGDAIVDMAVIDSDSGSGKGKPRARTESVFSGARSGARGSVLSGKRGSVVPARRQNRGSTNPALSANHLGASPDLPPPKRKGKSRENSPDGGNSANGDEAKRQWKRDTSPGGTVSFFDDPMEA